LYDRKLLLGDEKRNRVLELWEVHKYGVDSFSDADYLCIYGLKPADWYARGIRLLARTAVECTRDALGNLIGRDIAAAAGTANSVSGSVVIDPFVGSGNTLYWVLRNLPQARGIGFELDDSVYALSSKSIELVGAPIELIHEGYESGVKRLTIPPDDLIVFFVAPPWGDALREDTGLDLRRTRPPVREIVDLMEGTFEQNKILYAIQIYEFFEPQSIEELKQRFDWSALRFYEINEPGKNHGILLGTRGWSPTNMETPLL